MEADYWKPIQAGDLDQSDTHKVKDFVDNEKTVFHPNAFALQTPMSPHAAAAIDQVEITASKIKRPLVERQLVIEGAGGLLVPINDTETIADLIRKDDAIVLVSRHYLGSINHTLLSVDYLKSRGLKNIGLLFSGDEHPTTEDIILKKTQLPLLGRIQEEAVFNKDTIKKYANLFKEKLSQFTA